MFVVGMSPVTTTTSYAASKWGNSISSWLSGLKNQNTSKKEDTTQNEDTTAGNSTELGTANEGKNDTNPNDALNLSKSISKDKDGNYTINLEAYATGKVDVSTETKAKPTDIVLVLDQSASMLDDLSTTEEKYVKCNKTTNTELENTHNLYVKVGDNYYSVSVKYDWNWNQTYTYSYNNGTNTITTTSNGIYKPGPNWDFYTKETTTNTVTKEQALKTAVTQFVNSVQQQAQTNKVDYRVAIVGYGSSSRSYKNTEILSTQNIVNYSNATNNDYKNALVSANVNGSLNTRLSTAINRIIVETDTATSADHGMDMAKNVLANNTSTDRNKVVVMFTDGEPNHGSGFSQTVANTTIGTSKTIKSTYSAKVYTVGILSGANPDDISSNINKYMNYVSSNYPNATNLSTPGTGGSNQGYYMNATNSSQLNDIFEKISSDIETPSTSVTLNEKSILKDVISDNFTLPDSVTPSDIKVFTADFNGKDASGNYTWGTKQVFNDAVISIDNKTVNVSGFDYSSNYAVTVSGQNKGKKLIVQVPINIVRTFGGNNIQSNENISGIYDNGTIVKPFEIPDVDVAIDYKIAGTETWINEGESVNLDKLIGYVKDDDFEYKADGKKNKFVDLVYTIKDANGNTVGTYTIKAGETTGAWNVENTTGALDVDTEYTVECTVKPITDGTTKETTVESAKSYVYVRGVDKAFIIDFAKPVTYTKDKVFTKNQINTDEKVEAISKATSTDDYGKLNLNDDKSITYSLNKFMDGIDTYTFNVSTKAGTQTVKMVPGSSVYYEDNFGEERDADGNVTNSIITYDSQWEVVEDGRVVTSIKGDDPVGYDSEYEGNTKFSSGSAHKATATDTLIKATFKFKGSGIDLYGYTDNNTGSMKIQLYKLDKNGERISTKATYTALVDTKYNSGKVYQTPLFSYMGDEACNYEAVVTVTKGSTIYLDAMRIYYPIGNTNENYTEGENNIKYVDIREQIQNPTYFTVSGALFVDEHVSGHDTIAAHIIDLSKVDDKEEYLTYGRKREIAVAPGSTVTIKLEDAQQVLQLGARTNSLAPDEFKLNNATGKLKVNNDEINLTSATDMYYKVKVNDKNELVITNNTNYIITLTNLKLK